MKKPYTLLTPGPVLLTGPVLKILSEQPLYHRGDIPQNLVKEVKKDLQRFFQTKEPVIILTSTGTGSMEAALVNTLSPGDTCLCICSGKFGNRWKDIAQAHGLKTEEIQVPWGEAISPEEIDKKLKANKHIKALCILASETSTATKQPIENIGKMLKNHPSVLFLVDGITALGAIDLPMDDWNIDVLIGGSQKSFMLPTGLSFIALSKKAWESEKTSKCPKYYFHLKKERDQQEKGITAFSVNINFIKALKESLHFILNEQGLDKTINRCNQFSQATHAFCQTMGLQIFSKNPTSSVTAIQLPKHISAKDIKNSIEKNYNIVLAGGQDHLKESVIRIGHLGFIQNTDLLRGLEALGMELHQRDLKLFPEEKIKKSLEEAKKEI